MTRILVLGGGPAGLYAALLLARRSIPVTLLEREHTPGGLAAGRRVSGVSVDHGSHRLHPSTDPAIFADLRSMLGHSLRERPRNGRIRLGDRWLSFPLSPTDVFANLPLAVTARLAGGAVRASLTPDRHATFADVVATGLGNAMGELFYFPYARKIWGLDPVELSGSQARRRIAADTPAKLLAKALSSRQGRSFFYPDGGFGRIPDAIADAASRQGADLRLGSVITALDHHDGLWTARCGSEEHHGGIVLSTLPLTVLARLLGPPPEITAALGSLVSRAMVLVYLTVGSSRWTPYDAHYFPGEDIPFTRISEPKNYRAGNGDPSGRTVLCVEIPCDVDDARWSSPDDLLARSVREKVLALGLPDCGTDAVVHRIRHAYPVYRVGTEAALATVDEWLTEQPGLVTYGRQGLFAHDNTHHALAMARDVVECIDPALGFDAAGWAQARARFAEHVVED